MVRRQLRGEERVRGGGEVAERLRRLAADDGVAARGARGEPRAAVELFRAPRHDAEQILAAGLEEDAEQRGVDGAAPLAPRAHAAAGPRELHEQRLVVVEPREEELDEELQRALAVLRELLGLGVVAAGRRRERAAEAVVADGDRFQRGDDGGAEGRVARVEAAADGDGAGRVLVLRLLRLGDGVDELGHVARQVERRDISH